MLVLDVTVTGGQLGAFTGAIIVGIVGLVFVMRSIYSKRSSSGLAEQYESKPGGSPLEGRNKYPGADVFKLSGTFFNLGLVVAVGLTVLAFGWTQF